jgi:hypothetical protein
MRLAGAVEGGGARAISGTAVLVAGAALCVLAFLVAWRGLAGPYQFDDFATPLSDPASQSLQAWVKHLPITLRPVTKLTYAAEAQAGLGGSPAARRVVSISLQGVAAVLLFLLLTRLEPAMTALGAGLAAAIWLVHPVHAESVLLVSGRTALLAALFLLGALLALELRRPVVAAVLFALACLSRETALAGILPIAVQVWSRPGESPRAKAGALAPTLAAGAAGLLWLLGTPRYLELAEFSFLGRPWWKSFVAQVGAVPVGLGLLARPSRLSIDYGLPLPTDGSDPFFLLGLLLYAGAAVAILVLARRSRIAAVGVALWLAALLPTQSLVPKLDALTNRPLSLAWAGVVLALAPAAALLVRARPPRWLQCVAVASAVAVIASLGLAAAERAGLYRSELTLWGDAASKSRANPRPHLQYAVLLKEEGRNREAWEAISLARAIDPFSPRIEALWKVLSTR